VPPDRLFHAADIVLSPQQSFAAHLDASRPTVRVRISRDIGARRKLEPVLLITGA
jgi:hypothetical protein